MEGLEIFSAAYTAIEKLPDSFVGLINLVELYLTKCKKLRNLPNSIWKLKLLKELYLDKCSNLEQLPEQLEKMQCVEYLSASCTGIEQVPDSIGLLSRLRVLDFKDCQKLKFVTKSIWNLISIQELTLYPGETGKISLPDSVKNMKKLQALRLSCNVRLCLPMILCFSSLKRLTLTDEGQILSSEEPFSLSKLINLEMLELDNCTSLGSSLPVLPLNLKELCISSHNSLEQLPDLSSLRKLKYLYIHGCINLQSISLLPFHLQSLFVEECTSLQDVTDLSMLKELVELSFTRCNNLKSISLKPSSLEVGQPHLPFMARLPNREVAEWFSYKSRGNTISFVIPPSFGCNILGLALWFVYTCKATDDDNTSIRAVITNNRETIIENCQIFVHTLVGEAQSSIKCITGENMSMRSGDRFKVSFRSLMYTIDEVVPIGEVKVKMCGVHMITN
ncbi:hypothetical protein AgCh_033477 [Apium graveolens]